MESLVISVAQVLHGAKSGVDHLHFRGQMSLVPRLAPATGVPDPSLWHNHDLLIEKNVGIACAMPLAD
jgi:hypothetical protein